ncbi:nicotinate-nucleotide diphosphorylase [Desulfobacterium sp. N47]|uniref:Probable nicotinate-nucleotide pyrophosphorylase [carboxylating] n=1 Tax=uncultured Desulfobacterium sp. TaxID=201089 RepID=E1YGJ0_9BACT|nr:Probable nicotinate-nucleotide pyrophosphorylase [carboxylating] [uncultured Desulfobacterium sp.]
MHSIKHLIQIALEEDIGSGDITTDYTVDPEIRGKGIIVAKEKLVIAGLKVAMDVFDFIDPEVICKPLFKDGDLVQNGDTVMEIEGKLCVLLKGERTALNFMQRLSGIATNVRSYVELFDNKKIRLVDTRKTIPGWRVLEKYAVRVGGAYNHRIGLYDGVLIKDNHIAACGGISKAIERIRDKVSHLVKIEVEVSDLMGVKEALAAKADIIMLDNMDVPQIKEAVALIDKKAVVEISGGVTRENLGSLIDTGADIVSVGALTHSARSVDLSMRIIQ